MNKQSNEFKQLDEQKRQRNEEGKQMEIKQNEKMFVTMCVTFTLQERIMALGIRAHEICSL